MRFIGLILLTALLCAGANSWAAEGDLVAGCSTVTPGALRFALCYELCTNSTAATTACPQIDIDQKGALPYQVAAQVTADGGCSGSAILQTAALSNGNWESLGEGSSTTFVLGTSETMFALYSPLRFVRMGGMSLVGGGCSFSSVLVVYYERM